MRAGPKALPTGEPLDLRPIRRARGGNRVIRFIEAFCRLTRGPDAGSLIELREWQKTMVRAFFDDPRPRQGLVLIGRKNGKSEIASALALFGLLADEVQGDGREVIVVAGDERQARVIFDTARAMVERDERLAGVVQVFQNKIVHPASGSTFEALPADGARLLGRNPTLALVDEVAVVPEATWVAMATAGGTRPRPLTLGLTTPGADLDGIAYRLREHGRAGNDPTFRLVEYAAPDGCAVDDEAAWALANPALHDFLSVEHLRSVVATTREATFRRLHLGQWVVGGGAWIDRTEFAACADPTRVVADGDAIVLGFDGSFSRDSTALVGCTVESPHLFVVGAWENTGDPQWRVERSEVLAAIDAAMSRYEVRRLAADPWGWHGELEELAAKYGDDVVLTWPTNALPRMAPACDRLFQAIKEGSVTHDGDSRLARHFGNAHARSTPLGDVLVKDRRGSPRKIDLAVAAVVAFDVAATAPPLRRRSRRVVSF